MIQITQAQFVAIPRKPVYYRKRDGQPWEYVFLEGDWPDGPVMRGCLCIVSGLPFPEKDLETFWAASDELTEGIDFEIVKEAQS
jgi:hypothetical protein